MMASADLAAASVSSVNAVLWASIEHYRVSGPCFPSAGTKTHAAEQMLLVIEGVVCMRLNHLENFDGLRDDLKTPG